MGDVMKGSCLCRAVTFAVSGAVQGFYLCHCSRCQKDSGSAHGATLFVPGGQLDWVSGRAEVRVFTLPGTRHRKAFCATCGSALPNVQGEEAALVAVPAGALDTPIADRPVAHLCGADRAAWDHDLHLVPTFSGLPE